MQTRVLIVDDFPLARDGLRAWLEANPEIEVVGEAGDGDAALALAGELRPDVVLVDMTMPGLSGAALVGRLCHDVPECRPLVVSADERPDTMLEAIAAGACGYITKRVDGAELSEAVRAVAAGGSAIPATLVQHLARESGRFARRPGCLVAS
jgi:DNA-binding NarL/FixJ family response regulator